MKSCLRQIASVYTYLHSPQQSLCWCYVTHTGSRHCCGLQIRMFTSLFWPSSFFFADLLRNARQQRCYKKPCTTSNTALSSTKSLLLLCHSYRIRSYRVSWLLRFTCLRQIASDIYMHTYICMYVNLSNIYIMICHTYKWWYVRRYLPQTNAFENLLRRAPWKLCNNIHTNTNALNCVDVKYMCI